MPRYRAHLTQRIYECCSIEVEADSLEDAQELINEAVDNGEPDWAFLETDEWNVNEIEELAP